MGMHVGSFFISKLLTLSPPDGPYGPINNTVKGYFARGKVQKIVNVLMAVLNIYAFT